MNNKPFYAALTLIATLFIFISCSDDNSTWPSSEDVRELIDNNDYYHLQEVIENWDDGSLNGIIFLNKEYNKVYHISTINNITDSTDHEFTSYSSSAGFFKSDFTPYDVNGFHINDVLMSGSLQGKYRKIESEPYIINFGLESNRIDIESNGQFNALQDTFLLGEAVQISNFTRGDTMSKSLGYTLNWSGSPSATKAYISVSHTNSFDPKILSDTVTSGVSWYQDNTGNVELKPFLQNVTFAGTYDLSVTLFEPHYIELSNGKQLLVLGESTHRVSFNLTE